MDLTPGHTIRRTCWLEVVTSRILFGSRLPSRHWTCSGWTVSNGYEWKREDRYGRWSSYLHPDKKRHESNRYGQRRQSVFQTNNFILESEAHRQSHLSIDITPRTSQRRGLWKLRYIRPKSGFKNYLRHRSIHRAHRSSLCSHQKDITDRCS